jgi:hypothetical protein
LVGRRHCITADTPDDLQDFDFTVDHVRGEAIVALLGFTEDGFARPQKILIQLDRSGWYVEVLDVRCARRAEGTSIAILTTAGTVILREVDRSDPHSDSGFLWVAKEGDG